MATTIDIRIRGDTAANWETKNPILKQRELGYDMTAKRLKVGDGLTAWKDLAYVAPDVIDDLTTGGETEGLSAEQGKVLFNKITEINKSIDEGVIQIDDLTSEVWKFTLNDDTEVEKKVALWSS